MVLHITICGPEAPFLNRQEALHQEALRALPTRTARMTHVWCVVQGREIALQQEYCSESQACNFRTNRSIGRGLSFDHNLVSASPKIRPYHNDCGYPGLVHVN